MKFDKHTPCNNCPFVKDKFYGLTRERKTEIAAAIALGNKTFACHKTTHEKSINKSHCAGALIMLKKTNTPNQMVQIASRIGLYDESKLNMEVDTFNTFMEFVNHKDKPRNGEKNDNGISSSEVSI